MDRKIRTKALQALSYGLYVVGTTNDGAVSTILANWVTQVSFDPALVAVAIEKDSSMKQQIERSGVFSINMLPAGGKDIARAFFKPSVSVGTVINGREFTLLKRGTPILSDARAALECSVVLATPMGDHVLFVGEVTDAVTRRDGDVLTLRETGWHYFR